MLPAIRLIMAGPLKFPAAPLPQTGLAGLDGIRKA
jgi:hypothetical protein